MVVHAQTPHLEYVLIQVGNSHLLNVYVRFINVIAEYEMGIYNHCIILR